MGAHHLLPQAERQRGRWGILRSMAVAAAALLLAALLDAEALQDTASTLALGGTVGRDVTAHVNTITVDPSGDIAFVLGDTDSITLDGGTSVFQTTGTIDLTKQDQTELATTWADSTLNAARTVANMNRAYWRMLLRMYGWRRAA